MLQLFLALDGLHESETSEESAENDGEAIVTGEVSHLSSTRVLAEVGDDLVVGALGGSGGGAGGRGCLVGWGGVLGTTRVVFTAGARAFVVLPAGKDALVAVLGASEIGEGEGVLGDVGLLAVATDAAVSQGLLFNEQGLVSML